MRKIKPYTVKRYYCPICQRLAIVKVDNTLACCDWTPEEAEAIAKKIEQDHLPAPGYRPKRLKPKRVWA